MDSDKQRDVVSKYYGETLQSSKDLRTSACCPLDAVPEAHKKILARLHPEVLTRFYGCGSPIPKRLSGITVLDLGCGTGRDAYLASALVGRSGSVIAIDMTDEQLAVARQHQSFHARQFFDDPTASNVDFRKGFIEDLGSAGVEDASVDLVISNCVCNLSPQKAKVFAEVFRVLKPGGEFYFSDIYADRRLTSEAAEHPILISECLGGALYLEDFRRIMSDVGFLDPRIVSAAPVIITDPSLTHLAPDVTFYSVTFRIFKIDALDDRRENYQQTVKWTPPCCSTDDAFRLDVDNSFRANVETPVDGNTALMLEASRFSPEFQVSKPGTHKGLFTQVSSLDDVFNSFRALNNLHSEQKLNGKSPRNVNVKCEPNCC